MPNNSFESFASLTVRDDGVDDGVMDDGVRSFIITFAMLFCAPSWRDP